MNLKEIIIKLQETVKELDLSVNETVIFEQACSYHRGMLANKNFKENRDILNPVKQTKSNEPEPQNKIVLATAPQLTSLIRLGFKGDLDKVTKQEAWKIINERKGGKP